MARQQIAGILILLLLLVFGYLQEQFIINLLFHDSPLLLGRLQIGNVQPQFSVYIKATSTVIYYIISCILGSVLVALWTNKNWGWYTFASYLLLGILSLIAVAFYVLFDGSVWLALARTFKIAYLSPALPLLWAFLYFYQNRLHWFN